MMPGLKMGSMFGGFSAALKSIMGGGDEKKEKKPIKSAGAIEFGDDNLTETFLR